MELSQMSSWTGESVFNVKTTNALKKKQRQNYVDESYKKSMPDKEEMVDTIIALRQTKNIQEEQVRILKVTVAKLQKSLYIEQEKANADVNGRSDWIKH